jgi:cation-transporting ATPase E
VISGPELDVMDEIELAKAAEETTVFGRITPQQKEKLVEVLRARGHYVAMIGDGVNDVLSLKKAHIGIAMQSGSQATRGVADIVLLNDSFAALPPAFREGQRIVSGMQDIMRLFLTRTSYMAMIVVGAAVIGLGFPFTPIHSSLLSLLTVGIPTLALAAWARPAQRKAGLIRSVGHFVLPAAMTLALFGLSVYMLYYTVLLNGGLGVSSFSSAQDLIELETVRGLPMREIFAQAEQSALVVSRTVLTSLLMFGGLLLVVFVEPPVRFFTGGDELSGDWKPTILAVLLAAVYAGILLVPGLRRFFDLAPLGLRDAAIIGAALLVWAFLLRLVWRARLFERFLRLDDLRG